MTRMKLWRRYRRLAWWVHSMVMVHLLAAALIVSYFALRWYAPRRMFDNMNWSTPPSEKLRERAIVAVVFDRLELGGDGWVTFWFSAPGAGWVVPGGKDARFGWPVRHPDQILVRSPHRRGQMLGIYEGSTFKSRLEPDQ